MYKEKYLKYKSKYLDLKNQLDSYPNIIQDGGKLLEMPWSIRMPWSTRTSEIVSKTSESVTKTYSVTKTIQRNTDKTNEINEAFATPCQITTHLIIDIDSLSDTEFEALINGINTNTTITTFELFINELTPDKYIQLANAITQNTKIKYLTIKYGTDTQVPPPPTFIKALLNQNNNKELHLHFKNTIDDEGASILLDQLEQNNNIKIVLFENNAITPENTKKIEAFLKRKPDVTIDLSVGKKKEQLIQ